MAGELGRDWSLPLLPAGFAIFEALPVGALVLDALAPVIGNGMITIRAGESEGALVVRNGVVSERVWVSGGVRSYGNDALALIRSADTAMVSARRLGDEAMILLGPLLHGDPCYTDLRLEWITWAQFLGDLCARGPTFLVEVNTPGGRGVACVQGGRQVATYTESHPTLGDASLLDDLAAGGVGTVRVLVDNGAHDGADSVVTPSVESAARFEPGASAATTTTPLEATAQAMVPAVTSEHLDSHLVAAMSEHVELLAVPAVTSEHLNSHLPAAPSDQVESLAVPEVTSEHIESPTLAVRGSESIEPYVLPAVRSEHRESHALPTGRPDRAEPYVLPPATVERIPLFPAQPATESTDDPNEMFSAMFGPQRDASDEYRFVARDGTQRGAERQVASVLPQLKLLVQHRLQRSSESVEEIVESAAADHQNVGWLTDRVRVMTMRGFLHSTFDQLADDMLALAGRDPA